MNIETLETEGFVALPYPTELREAVNGALLSWQHFCTLPIQQKRLLSGGDRIDDFGYMMRNEVGPRADSKELFHALRANSPLLLEKAEGICDPRGVAFISATDTLIEHMQPTVEAFTRSVASRYTLPGFIPEVMNSVDYWTFRFLRYPKGKPVLANGHADRGGFTFHLCETEGGGEYYGLDRQWRPWPVSEEQTIIFPSMGLQFRSQNQVKALWHRVMPLETEQAERYAMVAFIDFQMSHRFDDRRQKRIQAFDAGFNYDIPFGEFEKLFVPREELFPG